MLLKVLVFNYTQGIRSSRKIDRLLERDIAFRYHAANQQPDSHSISDFRREHREDFRQLFVEMVRLCSQPGMAQMGEVAMDGRRVQATPRSTRIGPSNQVKDFIDESKLKITYCPTGSPDLKSVEEYWRQFKRSLGNHFFQSIGKLRNEALTALEAVSPPKLNDYFCILV